MTQIVTLVQLNCFVWVRVGVRVRVKSMLYTKDYCHFNVFCDGWPYQVTATRTLADESFIVK